MGTPPAAAACPPAAAVRPAGQLQLLLLVVQRLEADDKAAGRVTRETSPLPSDGLPRLLLRVYRTGAAISCKIWGWKKRIWKCLASGRRYRRTATAALLLSVSCSPNSPTRHQVFSQKLCQSFTRALRTHRLETAMDIAGLVILVTCSVAWILTLAGTVSHFYVQCRHWFGGGGEQSHLSRCATRASRRRDLK